VGRRPKKAGIAEEAHLVSLRLSPIQWLEIRNHLDALNEQRRSQGLSILDAATWLKDLAMREVGLFELTSTGRRIAALGGDSDR
jgi:hypothetical protein